MSDLRELYQEVILDHNKQPRNFRVLETADRQAEGHNPLCGDRVTVYLELEGERVHRIAFQGVGCAISQASASMMTEALEGKTLDEARQLFHSFRNMLTEETAAEADELGKLEIFAGVKQYPMRVKCATLPWHTLRAALDAESAPSTVSTE
jgi:nitrogen fixation NifU-like protein